MQACNPVCRSAGVASCSIAPGVTNFRKSAARSTWKRSVGTRAFDVDSAVSGAEMVSHVLTAAAVAGAAALLFNQGGAVESEGGADEQPCPRCNGSGYEACMCARWSDGDNSGCSSCSRTGYMTCRSCRGGGKAVPLFSTVRKNNNGGRSSGSQGY